jgi:hypothetical protein
MKCTHHVDVIDAAGFLRKGPGVGGVMDSLFPAAAVVSSPLTVVAADAAAAACCSPPVDCAGEKTMLHHQLQQLTWWVVIGLGCACYVQTCSSLVRSENARSEGNGSLLGIR